MTEPAIRYIKTDDGGVIRVTIEVYTACNFCGDPDVPEGDVLCPKCKARLIARNKAFAAQLILDLQEVTK